MVSVSSEGPIPEPLHEVDEDERDALSITRLNDLFSGGMISHQRFSEVLEQVFAAPDRATFEGA